MKAEEAKQIIAQIKGGKKSEGSGASANSAFTFLGDAPASPPRELIKKILPADGVVILGGQSSAGKTFTAIHKAKCLATGLPFFGQRIVERVGTAFIAAEGTALINNRFAASLAHDSITDKLPIAWAKQNPDFSSAEGIKRFKNQLIELNRRFSGDYGLRLGQFVIDTVSALFAMKSEDDNAEATRICNTLRDIATETKTLAVGIHHYGKNLESGLRGASAWRGCSEVVLGALADLDPLTGVASNRELVCAKARDGEQGPISPFELKFVELGIDQHGDIYGSCCVVPSEGAPSRFDKTKSKSARAIENAITEALDGMGKIITPRAGMVPVRAVKVTDVRKEFDRRYVVDEVDPTKAADAKRKAFKRALDHLSPMHFGVGAAEGTDWIWRTN